MATFEDDCHEEIPDPRNKKNQRKTDRCFTKLDEIEDSWNLEQDMRKDFLRLDIFFQSMTTSLVQEEPKYTVRNSKY